MSEKKSTIIKKMVIGQLDFMIISVELVRIFVPSKSNIFKSYPFP